MTSWWNYHESELPPLDGDTREFVEYMTGRVPLLLRSLFQFKSGIFDRARFLQSTELVRVRKQINTFYERRLASDLTLVQRRR